MQEDAAALSNLERRVNPKQAAMDNNNSSYIAIGSM